MKKIIFIFCSVFVLSCSNDTDLEKTIIETNTTDNSNESFNERAGDGIYDLLGAGYDVTGDYANASAAGNQVLNIPKFKLEKAAKFTDQILTEAPTFKETYGENALTFSQNLSYSLDATSNFYLFGSTFDQSNTMTDFTFNEKYIFGSYNLVKKQKRLKVTTTIAELKNYLMPKFIADINDKSAAEIVENYGTHVLLDIYTGASMEVLFQSQTTNTDRIAASRSGVKSSLFINI